MDAVTLRQYETLSPFEIKNDLAKMAAKTARASQVAYLNAGRGNPNWVATTPREAFFTFGQFCLEESKRVWDEPGLGGMPHAEGMADRLRAFLERAGTSPGALFLRRALEYGVQELGFDADEFVHELVDGTIGDNYPGPDRILNHIEMIVHLFLAKTICDE